jgi:hypothetical protein
MTLREVPDVKDRNDVLEYAGALGIHALEVAHKRLVYDTDSSTKLLLDFAELSFKVADLMPKGGNGGLISTGPGAVINFHFSKAPPGKENATITIENEVTFTELALPEPTNELKLEGLLLNQDLISEYGYDS